MDRARQVPMATGISILSRLLRCTLHFRDGSIARITASQHFCPLHPNKQTRQDGLNATLCADFVAKVFLHSRSKFLLAVHATLV